MITLTREAAMTNFRDISPDFGDCRVIHPLDDVAEIKHSPEGLGEMPMSASVKFSLLALRGYLVFIGLAVGYRVLALAGAFGHHVH